MRTPSSTRSRTSDRAASGTGARRDGIERRGGKERTARDGDERFFPIDPIDAPSTLHRPHRRSTDPTDAPPTPSGL